MVEGNNPEQSELRSLIHDVENRIEELSAALNVLRGAVTRLSAAATLEGGSSLESSSPAATVTPPPPAASPANAWSSVLDGASWPGGSSEPEAEEAQEGFEAPGLPGADESAPASLSWEETLSRFTSAAREWRVETESGAADTAAHQADDWSFDTPAFENADWTSRPADPASEGWPFTSPEQTHPSWGAAFSEPGGNVSDEWALPEADGGSQSGPEPQQPLAGAWPDESLWSQSFEWPAMRRDEEETAADAQSETEAPEPELQPDDVRSIVEQVKAEIEAAKRGEKSLADLLDGDEDWARDVRAVPPEDGVSEEEHANGHDTQAESTFEWPANSHAAANEHENHDEPPAPETEAPEDDEAAREAVRRAVEAAKAELGGESGDDAGEPKPAFPLAASMGGFQDWTAIPAEPSAPPVIVVKDSDGRVELARVYEALNVLNCGDSASLLNYTPHSVTIGLPVRAKVPSVEEVEEVVHQVFGRQGRVDWDGMRITVNMGADSKNGNREGAA